LIQLLRIGANINWVLNGEGPMLLKHVNQIDEDDVPYRDHSKEIRSFLKLIDKKIRETTFPEDKKRQILQDTLREIILEQNQFELNSMLDQEE